jgi:lipopolysaccharide export system protein LptA
MILRLLIALPFCLALVSAQTPPIQGKISGGFQAPSTVDSKGRRSVVKGTDATPQGNNIYLITDPRVTSYIPDDTPEMFISAPRCLLDLKSNLAWSDAGLSVKTADGKFLLEGTGWRWDPNASELIISNQVAAIVEKSVLAAGMTNQAVAGTNQPVRITASRFQQEGERASFIGNVLVLDGADTLRCARLNLEFEQPGGVQRVEAIQDVELTQANARVRSGHAVYDLKEETLTITRNPVWMAEGREGSAEKMLLNRLKNTLFAEGKVFMKLPLTNVVAGPADREAVRTNQFVEIYSERFEFRSATSNTLATAIYSDQVRVVHPQASIRCAELTAGFDREQQIDSLLARGAVEIESEGSRAYGETADYDLAQGKFSLSGNPHWVMDENKGRSETVVFYPETEEILALGGVQMLLAVKASDTFLPSFGATHSPTPATNAPMRITSATFSHQGNLSVFHEGVKITDARGMIECELLTVVTGATNQLQRMIAENGVRITQKDLAATGSRAEYDARTGLVHLTGDPQLTGPDKSLRAESFIIDRQANSFSVAPGTYRMEIRLKKGERLGGK